MNFEAFIRAIISTFFFFSLSRFHSLFYMMIDDDSLWVCETISIYSSWWCRKEWKLFHFFFLLWKRWERNKSSSLHLMRTREREGERERMRDLTNFYRVMKWLWVGMGDESVFRNGDDEINCSWKCILTPIQGLSPTFYDFHFSDKIFLNIFMWISWDDFMLNWINFFFIHV